LIEHQTQLIDLLAQCEKETDLISASDEVGKKRVRFLERAERRVENKREDDELWSELVSNNKQSLSQIDFSKSMIEIIIDSYRVFLQIDQVLLPLHFFFFLFVWVCESQLIQLKPKSKPNFTQFSFN
jgi:hypothetical protein